MPYPNPSYVDGLNQVVALSVYCYNNGLTYMTYSGDPSLGAAHTDNKNSDNQLIGSVTYIDGRKGTLVMQYNLATDETPSSANQIKPSYIVSFRGRYYVIGNVKTPIVKNDVIKTTCDVTELQNPFVAILLSIQGQQLVATHAANSSYTVACAASNTRTGATLVYSGQTFATPGSSLPSGFSINSSTGVLTINAAAATYDVRVVVSDTITLGDGTTDTIYGFGRYTVTLS
jgi:hypothetical protein